MLSDYSWATPPTDGVASDEDVAFLRSWLDGFRNPTSDPFDGCEPLFPVRRSAAAVIQRSVDPYGNLWGENYTVDSVRSSTHVTSESLSGRISSVTFFLRLEHLSQRMHSIKFDIGCSMLGFTSYHIHQKPNFSFARYDKD